MNYTIKISLNSVKPTPFRKFKVSDSITLLDLHYLIQIAFAWQGYHLFNFKRNGIEFSDDRVISFNESLSHDSCFYEEVLDAEETTLKSLDLKEKERFKYNYDFGAGWRHTIFIEKIEDSNQTKIEFLSGKGDVPEEDCMGVEAFDKNKIKQIKENINCNF